MLKYIDAVESDSSIFIVTERVRPLVGAEELGKGQSGKDDWVVWGVHRISVRSLFSLSLSSLWFCVGLIGWDR